MTAFVVSGVATTNLDLIGEPYADNTPYLPMFRQRVLVFMETKETLTTARSRALDRGDVDVRVHLGLFATGNDRDNRVAGALGAPRPARPRRDRPPWARNAVDKVFKGATMHP